MLPMLLQGLPVKLPSMSLPASRLVCCMGGRRMCMGCCLLVRPACSRAAVRGLGSSGLMERGGMSSTPEGTTTVTAIRKTVQSGVCVCGGGWGAGMWGPSEHHNVEF
jgi:hypothetical protein